jgi:hypothetical protein
MNYEKGQRVTVRDFEGKRHRMRVWQQTEKAVYVASEVVFAALEEGQKNVWPVGVPLRDIEAIRENEGASK